MQDIFKAHFRRIGAFVFGLLPFLKLVHYSLYFLYLLIPLILTQVLLRRYFKKWIGGYTGDCLGATQQIAEVVFYLSFIALWKFS